MKAIRETVMRQPGRSFTAYRYAEAEFYAPYHYHPEIEIVMIESGRGLRVAGDHTGSFEPMDLCLFGSNLPHIFRADDASAKASSFVIQFRLELIESLLELDEMDAISRLLEKAALGLQFSPATSKKLHDPLKSIACQPTGGNKLIDLLQLLEWLSEDTTASSLASPSYQRRVAVEKNTRLGRVWDRILQNEGNEPTQLAVATELGMSASAFSRMFRHMTGKTYRETIIEIRLGRACRLMLSPEVTIAQAAFQSGYNNLSIFNRHFKARYGMTPREWRGRVN